jgi:hypothetical protein
LKDRQEESMKGLLPATVLAAAFGTGAFAQDMDRTYAEIAAEGGLGDLSSMETRLERILTANGVPRECLGQLSVNDAVQMNLILNDGERSDRDRRDSISGILRERCP